VLVLAGFLTGVITQLAADDTHRLSWTNPVVLSLTLMTVWLLVAEVFRMLYPAARQGRKVAFLTMAAFVFLLLVFASVMWGDSFHTQRAEVNPVNTAELQIENCKLRIEDLQFAICNYPEGLP
jgi:hypothetical protein